MATAHGSVLLAMGIEAEASGLPGAPVHYQDSPRPTPAAIGPRSALEGCNELGPRRALEDDKLSRHSEAKSKHNSL